VSLQSDLLIIGAGPAGSATAIRAARAGLRVTMVDRARFPRDKPCSEYMSPETLKHLAALGVLETLEGAGGNALAGTTVIGPRGARLTGLFARAGHQPFRPTGLSLPRRILDHHLVEAARQTSATVLEEHAIEDLIYDRGAVAGAVVRDASGAMRVLRARLTVGADGLRSVVARRLGVRQHGHPHRLAFVAHLTDVPGLSDRAEMHVGPAGYVGLNPLGEGITNVALVVPQALAEGARGQAERFFLTTLESYPGIRGRIDGRRIVRRVLVTGPFAARSRRVVVDGALLVGDAADFFDPFTGEGICSALRGADLAVATALEALDRPGSVTADRLRSYARARRAVFGGKWAVERLIGYGMYLPALFDRAIGRLERRGWSHTLIGVTGDFVPAREVLNPRFLAGMIW